MNDMPLRYGVYFSANDRVYEWSVAFLNSFRVYNPELNLILIPFNEDCSQLLNLQQQYNFQVYEDETFTRLEAIGRALELGYTPTGHYWFRRYAAFWGPLDRFFYLDARQVVLADLEPLIQTLDAYDFDFLYYDCEIDQVYQPGVIRRELLRQKKARGFNSGRWMARKGLFTIEEFEKISETALKVREHLNPRNTDQAFINYCIDNCEYRTGQIAEVVGGIVNRGWARRQGRVYRDGDEWKLWDYGGIDHKKKVILLHWAGYRELYQIDNFLIYSQFRVYNSIWFFRVYHLIIKAIHRSYYVIYRMIKSNRFINRFYHSMITKGK